MANVCRYVLCIEKSKFLILSQCLPPRFFRRVVAIATAAVLFGENWGECRILFRFIIFFREFY
jgi:hypothetical protein